MERRLRAVEVARRAGAEALLASTPASVAWLTGFAAEIDNGPTPFSLPPLALVAGDGAVLIVSDDDAEAAAATGCEVRSYRGFSVEPIDAVGGASSVLGEGVGRRRVAVEAGALPAALAAGLDWVDVGSELARGRAVKDSDELTSIRAAIELCDVGQREARLRAAPGLTELEPWAHVRGAIEYPHHSGGHGLGCDWHEEPRIVPGSKAVLEAGMVVAFEPGCYEQGEGVRVEQVVLVTADGCEILSGHELEL
jgi:Xaa-Pro aminopeptidase